MKAMDRVMLSCKSATETIEKRNVQPLSVIEGLQLRMHLSMCKVCSAYEKKSNFIDTAMKQFTLKPNNNTTLPKENKEQIINKLDDFLKK
ncbi:hypothetical protein BH09BAC1_BH09BAC1_03980 [soil metagenome]